MEIKQRLIQQLDAARADMRALLAEVDVRQEIYPGWTMKHLLAHLAGWDDATIAALRAHAAGEAPETPASRGIDYYNAQTVETRQLLSFEHVVREWETTRDQLKAAIDAMPPERFAQPFVFPWGPTGTVAQIVAIMAHHEAEHAMEIRELMTDREAPDR